MLINRSAKAKQLLTQFLLPLAMSSFIFCMDQCIYQFTTWKAPCHVLDDLKLDKLQMLLREKRTGAIEEHKRIELTLCQHFTVTERTQAEAGQ